MSIAIKSTNITNPQSESKLRENLLYLMENATDAENINHFARIAGVPLSTMHKLLSNEKQSPKVDTLIPIAHKFDISIDQLIGIKPFSNIANEDSIAWNSKLYLQCSEEIIKASETLSKKLDYQTFIGLIDELYRYCIKDSKVDTRFAQWLIDNRNK